MKERKYMIGGYCVEQVTRKWFPCLLELPRGSIFRTFIIHAQTELFLKKMCFFIWLFHSLFSSEWHLNIIKIT